MKLVVEGFLRPANSKRPLPYAEAEKNRLRMAAERRKIAQQELHNQIRLAKMEAATAPLYRPRDLDW